MEVLITARIVQLQQFSLWCERELRLPEAQLLPPPLRARCRDALRAVASGTAEHHASRSPLRLEKSVGRALSRLGLSPTAEHALAEGYSVDYALVDERIAIEVDGPWHFALSGDGAGRRLLGRTLIKRRQLAALGWRLLEVRSGAGTRSGTEVYHELQRVRRLRGAVRVPARAAAAAALRRRLRRTAAARPATRRPTRRRRDAEAASTSSSPRRRPPTRLRSVLATTTTTTLAASPAATSRRRRRRAAPPPSTVLIGITGGAHQQKPVCIPFLLREGVCPRIGSCHLRHLQPEDDDARQLRVADVLGCIQPRALTGALASSSRDHILRLFDAWGDQFEQVGLGCVWNRLGGYLRDDSCRKDWLLGALGDGGPPGAEDDRRHAA